MNERQVLRRLRRQAEALKLQARQWQGRLKPRRPVYAAGYTPANREANEAIDRSRYGLAVAPGSGLAQMLATLRRPERRLLLATVQSANPVRRRRGERELKRRLTAQGIVR